jgi:hypothetical protein
MVGFNPKVRTMSMSSPGAYIPVQLTVIKWVIDESDNFFCLAMQLSIALLLNSMA